MVEGERRNHAAEGHMQVLCNFEMGVLEGNVGCRFLKRFCVFENVKVSSVAESALELEVGDIASDCLAWCLDCVCIVYFWPLLGLVLCFYLYCMCMLFAVRFCLRCLWLVAEPGFAHWQSVCK